MTAQLAVLPILNPKIGQDPLRLLPARLCDVLCLDSSALLITLLNVPLGYDVALWCAVIFITLIFFIVVLLCLRMTSSHPTQQLEEFFSHYTTVRYEKGERILREYDSPSGVFFLKKAWYVSILFPKKEMN